MTTPPFTLANTLAGISPITAGADHPSLPFYDAAALNHITELQEAWNSISVTFTRTSPTVAGADPPSFPLCDAAALSHITGLQTGDVILSSDTAKGTNGLTTPPFTLANTLAGISPITAGADHASLPFYDAAALSHITGLQTVDLILSGDTNDTNGLGALPFTFPATLAGIGPIITGTDSRSLSKSISELTASGRTITGWAITSTASEPRQ